MRFGLATSTPLFVLRCDVAESQSRFVAAEGIEGECGGHEADFALRGFGLSRVRGLEGRSGFLF